MTPDTGAARALVAETAADPTGPSPPAGLSVDCQRPARQRGFTLIELMISVLIVAILAMLGATAYEGAVMRARIAEGMNLVAPLKTLIHENLAVDRTANACSGVTDLTTPVGSVVSAVCTDDGSVATVRLTLNETAGDVVINFVNDRAASQMWQCVGDPTKPGAPYLPPNCRH